MVTSWITSADINDSQAVLQSIVDNPIVTGTHVVIYAGILLLVGGLLALHRSITGEPGAALARLGFTAAMMGASIMSVSVVFEASFATKVLVDSWATAADKAIPFAVAEAVLLLSGSIFFWGFAIYGGVAPFLYGLAIALTDFYPRWLGWVAMVVGTGNALIGIVVFDQGITHHTMLLFVAFFIALNLWLQVMGVLMWRRASAATKSVEASSLAAMTAGTRDIARIA
ncbi:MAG: hypothetical protein QGD96_12730 [Anaerolineae bacterium]|nr:hypothetical protein [Anaerolineae bacterium]